MTETIERAALESGERSPHELDAGSAFDGDGHLTDLALTFLADGADDLVPLAAREHTDQCTSCTERLADFAVLSLRVEGALLLPAPAAQTVAPQRFPAVAFAAVLAVPAVTVLRHWLASEPFAHAPLHRLFDFWALVRPLALALDHAARLLDSTLPLTSVFASLTFVLLGAAVVRLVRPITLEGPAS